MKIVVRLLALVLLLSAGAVRAADKIESFPIDMVMGNADAPVTIIEYASTTCGHCANLHKNVMPRIKAEWIDTGKARLIYRDFPTGPAQLSIGASMIAHCSGPQRYFGIMGLLFENQDKWMAAPNPLDALKKLVRLAGITSDEVDACLTRQDLANAIQDRARDGGKRYSIESTPSMIINGTLVEGARSYEDFDKALKAAAAKK